MVHYLYCCDISFILVKEWVYILAIVFLYSWGGQKASQSLAKMRPRWPRLELLEELDGTLMARNGKHMNIISKSKLVFISDTPCHAMAYVAVPANSMTDRFSFSVPFLRWATSHSSRFPHSHSPSLAQRYVMLHRSSRGLNVPSASTSFLRFLIPCVQCSLASPIIFIILRGVRSTSIRSSPLRNCIIAGAPSDSA